MALIMMMLWCHVRILYVLFMMAVLQFTGSRDVRWCNFRVYSSGCRTDEIAHYRIAFFNVFVLSEANESVQHLPHHISSEWHTKNRTRRQLRLYSPFPTVWYSLNVSMLKRHRERVSVDWLQEEQKFFPSEILFVHWDKRIFWSEGCNIVPCGHKRVVVQQR